MLLLSTTSKFMLSHCIFIHVWFLKLDHALLHHELQVKQPSNQEELLLLQRGAAWYCEGRQKICTGQAKSSEGMFHDSFFFQTPQRNFRWCSCQPSTQAKWGGGAWLTVPSPELLSSFSARWHRCGWEVVQFFLQSLLSKYQFLYISSVSTGFPSPDSCTGFLMFWIGSIRLFYTRVFPQCEDLRTFDVSQM